MAGPLAGVRIVDLSQIVSGPMAAALLAEQGDLDWSRLKGPITITNMTITEAMNGRVKRPPSGIVITVTNLTQIGQNVDKWWA